MNQPQHPAVDGIAAATGREDWTRSLPGAVIGSATGISALLFYTNGLFVAGLTQEFGLTRAQFGLGVLLVTIAVAAANPLVGWTIDRLGAKRPSIAGLILLSVGFILLGTFTHSVGSYFLLQVLLALLGAASGPIAYTKIIGDAFNKHRGVALGVTMTGIGLTAAVVPPVLAGVISEHGWRAGYYALALIPLFGAFVTGLLVPRWVGAGRVSPAPIKASGAGAPWVRSRVFWILAATFAMMSLSFGGLLPHFVPMLGDGGIDPLAAGRIAGQIGLAVIASRLVVGFLLDRIFAPRIAIVICLVAAAGCVALLFNGISSASLTAIALGLALGAELDLMGFLVARYFGLAQFGKIYGWLYCAFIFASGFGPYWVGAVRDATGNYALALASSAVGLVLTCVGFLLLPRYPASK